MSEKINGFKEFLFESSYFNLPSIEDVKSLPEFNELKKIFPDLVMVGGGKNPIEIFSGLIMYPIKFSRTGSIYYGGYSVGEFSKSDKITNEEIEFVKDYFLSKMLSRSLVSFKSILEGKTPINRGVIDGLISNYDPSSFKLGILNRIKDFSSTIKWYKKNPLDKSYEKFPELKKIVEEGVEKLPKKETKEGELSLEQKQFLRESISRRDIPENKGKATYILNKETGLVDVHGNFNGIYSPYIKSDLNFLGIRFGKIYGDFSVSLERILPEKNLSGFPYEVVNSLFIKGNGELKSLEGFPTYVGGYLRIEETLVEDFSPLGNLDLSDKEIFLENNINLKSLKDLNLPGRLSRLRITSCPIENMEGCPKEAGEISISSPKLNDISQILDCKVEKFYFRSDSRYHSIFLSLPLTKEENYGRIEKILNSKDYSEKDKSLIFSGNPEFYYKLFKENPTKIYLLDPYPETKKDVLKNTGLPDLSRIGRLKDMGWL